jgi:sucrose phosphorylase
MDNRTADRRMALLKELFDERQSAQWAQKFKGLIESHQPHSPSSEPIGRSFSSRDVVLIVYPDQLREHGKLPLRVLSDFCSEHLAGWITWMHLLPFFPSSSDDGFSITNYRAVDPDLGCWDDLTRFRKSFRLMVDAVINHVSVQSDWFRKFRDGEDPFRRYFIEVEGTPDLSGVVRPRSSPLLHTYGSGPKAKTVWTTFGDDQADLNFRQPDVLYEIADLLLFYASRGASVLRLDAAAYLWKEIGTPCVNLPQTHRLVQVLRSVLDEAAPDVFLAAETNVPHAENIAYFGGGSDEAHLVYNFALPPMILHTFRTGDSRPLSRWIDGLRPPSEKTTFLNFLASHDGIGLNGASDILRESDIQTLVQTAVDRGGRVSFRQTPDGNQQPYELNINFFDMLSAPADGEPLDLSVRRFLSAHGILLSLAGIPAIYFHSLFGSRGWRQGVDQTGSRRAINRQKFELSEFVREWREPSGLRRRIFEGMKNLIRARTDSRAFNPQTPQWTLDFGHGVFSIVRGRPGTGAEMLCLHNVTDQTLDLRINAGEYLSLAGDRTVTEIVSGRRYGLQSLNAFRLEPYQVCWFAPAEKAPGDAMSRPA